MSAARFNWQWSYAATPLCSVSLCSLVVVSLLNFGSAFTFDSVCGPLFEVAVKAGGQVEEERVSLQEHSVSAPRKSCCDFTGCLDPAQVEESWRSVHGLTEKLGGLGFTLSRHDSGLFVLHGLFDLEFSSLSLLLGDLLLLNSLGKLRAEMEIGNRDIIELDVEISQPYDESVPNSLTDLFSLG